MSRKIAVILLTVNILLVNGDFKVDSFPKSLTVTVGEPVKMKCKASDDWEYCTWQHLLRAKTCNFEWKYSSGLVEMQHCPSLGHRIKYDGDYGSYECGIFIKSAKMEDAGKWKCEMEEYYWGLTRGSVVSGFVDLTVLPRMTTTTSPPVSGDEVLRNASIEERIVPRIEIPKEITGRKSTEDEIANRFLDESVHEQLGDDDESVQKKSSFNSSMIVTISVSVLVVLITLIAVSAVLYRRRKKSVLEFAWMKSKKSAIEPVIPEDAMEYHQENNPEENQLDIDIETNTVSYTGSRITHH